MDRPRIPKILRGGGRTVALSEARVAVSGTTNVIACQADVAESDRIILVAVHVALGLRLVDLGAVTEQLARRAPPARPTGPVDLAG